MLGKIEDRRRRGRHHWLDGYEFEQALGVGDGQGSLACYSPWGRKESDKTERLNWTDAEAPILWPPDAKSQLTGKDSDAGKVWRQKEKETAEDEMVGWHHWLNGHEFEQASGVGEGQGSLACYSPWGRRESDTTEWLNWTELEEVIQFLSLFPYDSWPETKNASEWLRKKFNIMSSILGKPQFYHWFNYFAPPSHFSHWGYSGTEVCLQLK